MKNWIVELIAGWKTFAEVKIQRFIFQGDSLSQFLIAVLPLIYIFRECNENYKFIKSPEKIDHLL